MSQRVERRADKQSYNNKTYIFPIENHNFLKIGVVDRFKDKTRSNQLTTLCIRIYEKRLLLRCIHHFKSDLINNMDHKACAFRVMNPRQWSLVKQSSLKDANSGPNVSKQAEAKRDGVINPQNYNLI